jgi:predicted enzyme related to lactoylglutathione lyase
MAAQPTDLRDYPETGVEILSSRFLLHPTDLARSLRFYEQALGLAIYREWGEGASRGVAFFLGGGGLLEVSGGHPEPPGGNPEPPSAATALVLQVRDLNATRSRLADPRRHS